jgi:hypothetical protein
MADDSGLDPSIFDGMSLSPEEQPKVDMLKTNWKQNGKKAMDDFTEAEPFLLLKAIDDKFGPEAFRDVLIQELNRMGITRADLEEWKKRKPH